MNLPLHPFWVYALLAVVIIVVLISAATALILALSLLRVTHEYITAHPQRVRNFRVATGIASALGLLYLFINYFS